MCMPYSHIETWCFEVWISLLRKQTHQENFCLGSMGQYWPLYGCNKYLFIYHTHAHRHEYISFENVILNPSIISFYMICHPLQLIKVCFAHLCLLYGSLHSKREVYATFGTNQLLSYYNYVVEKMKIAPLSQYTRVRSQSG